MPTGLLSTDGKNSTSSTEGSSTGSYLIPRTLYNTLISAVRKKLVLRSLAAKVIGPRSIPGSSIDIPLQTSDSMGVFEVSEGAEIPMDVESYSSINLKPVKYGVRIAITSEMEEDSLFDVMAMNVETAGYQLADNEEALIVAQLDAASSAASNDVSGGASLTQANITTAMQKLEGSNYTPSHFVIGAEVANDIRNLDIFTRADASGVTDPSQRLIGKIFGMKVIVSNNVSAKLGYVLDANQSFIIAEKRPVTIQRYKDYARDTNFAVATQRVKVRYLRSGAVSEITTS